MLATPWVAVLLSTLAAEELLSRSIAYHDPDGRWDRGAFTLTLGESRPDGSVRRTVVRLDNGRGRFEIERELEGGRRMEAAVENDEVEVRLDGSSEISPSDRERHRLSTEQVLRTRNYYLYLYGLPMKLLDPGARLSPEAKESSFQGTPAFELRVTYDEKVGSDTWYFYFDRGTFALVGYRFYHDETARDGEYILLGGTTSGQGLKLPRERKWYRHQDDGYLGTDTLESITAP
jgi:hypothetical protein